MSVLGRLRRRPAAPASAAGRHPLRAFAYPVLVLGVGLLGTGAVTFQFLSASEARDAERFERLVDERVEEIEGRLDTYVALLRGTAGLFAAEDADGVTRPDFAAYVSRLNLPRFYPGVQGLAYVERVPEGGGPAIEARLRAAGEPGFAVRPPLSGEGAVIALIEPLDRRNAVALGFDMASEPVRRAALERARDLGEPAMSGRVELVQEIDAQKQPGFLVFLPVYRGGAVPETVEARRAALSGWTYAPFRAHDLFNRDFFGEVVLQAGELSLAVYDGTETNTEALLYRTGLGSADGRPAPAETDEGDGRRTLREIVFSGHPWTVAFTAMPGFAVESNRGLAPYLAGLGLLATLLLSAGALVEARARRGAEQARAALQEETLRLERLNEAGIALASELDTDRLVNRVIGAATSLLGAAYGAFFERVPPTPGTDADESWRLFSLAGAPAEAFTRFGLPRATSLFGPTFRGEGIVRANDVAADPRFGSHGGMPEGHLPVRSYLAVPVMGRTGERLGALLFGHPEPGRFGPREERLVVGIAGQAAAALDNARLFQAVAREVEERRHAEEELKESNEELQRYAYIVSHDLRSPLVNVMGFTSELEATREDVRAALGPHPAAGRIDADLAESLGFIKAAIVKMEGLIAAILKLSREGRRTFRAERLDMNALLSGLLDARAHEIDALDASIAVEPGLPAVEADRLAVEQIFANLVDNALKYRADGRAPVIAVSARPRPRGRVEFAVEDNGRGIAPKDHARVFELFRRAGVQDRPGEGIGLAHVRALVRALGGRIGLSSELGRGTRFVLTLPAADAAAAAPPAPAPVPVPAPAPAGGRAA